MDDENNGDHRLKYSRGEIWAIYEEVEASERHFNNLQEKYRVLTSTWLFASIAGIAYAFINEENLPISASIIASIIAFSGSVGINLIWILDIKIFQKMLSCHFEEGLILEQTQKWLPPIRTRIRRRFKGSVPVLISLYYIGSMSFLFFIGVMTLLISLKNGFELEILVPLLLALFSILTIGSVTFLSRQSKSVLRQENEQERIELYRSAVVYDSDSKR